jgi:hypothetical protein
MADDKTARNSDERTERPAAELAARQGWLKPDELETQPAPTSSPVRRPLFRR